MHILATAAVTAVLTGIIVAGNRFQSAYLSELNARKKASGSFGLFMNTTPSTVSAGLVPTLMPDHSDVLGTSTGYTLPPETVDFPAIPTSMPLPTAFPTFAPIPTSAPAPATAPLNCDGTATEYYSQVYLSTHTIQSGGTVTISIELRDCHNNLASDDNLAVTQLTNDGNVRINGQSGSVNTKAVNGKATFTVTTSTSGTVTLRIADTNQNFFVTEPGYKNPTITFSANSSGNANCPTGAGVPNFWYSNISPNSPITASNGSVSMTVNIKDCNKNLAPVSDSIQISLASGDSNTKINGNALPYTLVTQNGTATFTVTSQVSGTVGLVVKNTTRDFTVTDDNNHSPSITFSGNATNPTPTPTSAPASTPTPTPQSATPTPTPQATTPTTNPTPTPTGP